MYAQLGNIIFEGLVGYSSMEQTQSVNYAEHALILGKPKLQRVGSNLDDVKLGMLFHSRFCVPEAQILALTTAMNASEVLPFITGAGEIVGNFVITKIGRQIERTDASGRIVSVTVDVDLKEHDQVVSVDEAIEDGFAYRDNTPVVSIAPIAPQSLTALAAEDMNRSFVAERAAVTALEAEDLEQTSTSLGDMGGALQDAAAKLNQTTGDINEKIQDLNADIAELLIEVNTVKDAADASNLALALLGLEDLTIASNKVKRSNATLASLVASRR
jgi:phage protein U